MKQIFSPYFQKQIFSNSTGSAIPNVKGVKDLKIMPFPLLPLKEQRRIVSKFDKLTALCDQLKGTLQEAQQTQIHLTDAVLENAL